MVVVGEANGERSLMGREEGEVRIRVVEGVERV